MASEADEIFYSHAPILEAVVELRFAEVPTKKAKKIAGSLRSRYEYFREEEQIEGNLDFVKRSSSFRALPPLFRLSSWDETNLLILSSYNVTWSRLAPYEGWEQFEGRFREEMSAILKGLSKPQITRIGLRYVNRIDAPIDDAGLCHHEEFLKFRIDGSDLLEPHGGYQWTLQKEFPEENLAATVNSGTVMSELPGHGSVSFDIDIFRTVDVPSDVDDILGLLINMRRLKNRIFEAGITDKARALFNAANA